MSLSSTLHSHLIDFEYLVQGLFDSCSDNSAQKMIQVQEIADKLIRKNQQIQQHVTQGKTRKDETMYVTLTLTT